MQPRWCMGPSVAHSAILPNSLDSLLHSTAVGCTVLGWLNSLGDIQVFIELTPFPPLGHTPGYSTIGTRWPRVFANQQWARSPL